MRRASVSTLVSTRRRTRMHAQARALHPHRLGQQHRARLVDRGPDDDGVLAEVGVDVAAHGFDGVEHDGVAERSAQRLGDGLVEIDDGGHLAEILVRRADLAARLGRVGQQAEVQLAGRLPEDHLLAPGSGRGPASGSRSAPLRCWSCCRRWCCSWSRSWVRPRSPRRAGAAGWSRPRRHRSGVRVMNTATSLPGVTKPATRCGSPSCTLSAILLPGIGIDELVPASPHWNVVTGWPAGQRGHGLEATRSAPRC